MTPQLLIVKIRSVLAGTSGASERERRALAEEYFSVCTECAGGLERVAALVRSGREYPALQVAESCGLLDSINALLFAELPAWRDFCAAADMPCPPPFDPELLSLAQSLYERGITQTHPLYRDFRRAMRFRNFPEALSVIRTISKINSNDAEAARECEKLRVRVAKDRVGELSAALGSGDESEILRLCGLLQPDSDIAETFPIWNAAKAAASQIADKRAAARRAEILGELAHIDAEKNFKEASELVSEIYSLADTRPLSQSESEIVEKVAAAAASAQARDRAEKRARLAMDMLAAEVEIPASGADKKRLAKLRELRKKAGEKLAEGELSARVGALEKSLSRALLQKRIALFAAAASVAVCAGIAAYWTAEKISGERRAASAGALIALAESTENPNLRLETARKFAEQYPDFARLPSYSARLAKITETASAQISETARIRAAVGRLEKTDFAAARSEVFDAAAEKIAALDFDIAALPQVSRTELKQRLAKVSETLEACTEKRKIARSDELRSLLDSYESLLSEYRKFSAPLAETDARRNALLAKIRPLVEDTSEKFRPHQIDTDRFDDITAKISAARAKYEKFSILRDALFSSRTVYDYLSALEMLSRDGVSPARFFGKLSRISVHAEQIRLGRVLEFVPAAYVEKLGGAFSADKAVLPEKKFLFGVRKYFRQSGRPVYSAGVADERTQRWQSGFTTVQEVPEISIGGKITTVRYMKSGSRGRAETGELLSGGSVAPECLIGREVFKTASAKSLLSALSLAANANVNPAYKLYLESLVFEKLKRNPVGTGFAFSPIARGRAEKVEKLAAAMSDYSWIFEKNSRLEFLKGELYSAPLPDLEAEARAYVKAAKIAAKNPLEMIAVVDENGKVAPFKSAEGKLWAVSAAGFGRIDSESEAVPLSPVFAETLTTAEILEESKK